MAGAGEGERDHALDGAAASLGVLGAIALGTLPCCRCGLGGAWGGLARGSHHMLAFVLCCTAFHSFSSAAPAHHTNESYSRYSCSAPKH